MNNMTKLTHRRVAEGEATGHYHSIAADDAILYGDEAAINDANSGTIVIDAPHGTDVTHQEHHTVRLPPGQYIRGIVQEWDHFAKKARQLDD